MKPCLKIEKSSERKKKKNNVVLFFKFHTSGLQVDPKMWLFYQKNHEIMKTVSSLDYQACNQLTLTKTLFAEKYTAAELFCFVQHKLNSIYLNFIGGDSRNLRGGYLTTIEHKLKLSPWLDTTMWRWENVHFVIWDERSFNPDTMDVPYAKTLQIE